MNKQEFEKVFKDNYRQMYRMAMNILADSEESHDVVHDVFARLLESRTEVRAATLPSFLLSCVRNQCMNVIKHKGVRKRFEQQYTAQMKDCVADDSIYDSRRERLTAFINARFTDRMKQVFRMKYFEGMKYREIADKLGISQVAVYKHLARCLEDVKTNFKNSSYGQE